MLGSAACVWTLWGQGLFANAYGTETNQKAQEVIQTQDGGYLVVGSHTGGLFAITENPLMVKLDSAGTPEWTRSLLISGSDGLNSAVETGDGGFVAVGYTEAGAGGWDVLLVKVDSAGGLVWAKAYGGSGDEVGYRVIESADGGYVLVGYSDSFGYESRALVVKVDSSGNLEWAKTYEVPSVSTKGYAIAKAFSPFNPGYFLEASSASGDALVLRTDTSGSLVWAKGYSFNPVLSLVPEDIHASAASLVLLFNFLTFPTEAILVSCERSSGDPVWAYGYTYGTGVYANRLVSSSDGYLLAGTAYPTDFWAAKVSLDGSGVLWSSLLTGDTDDVFLSACEAPDGGYVLAGYTESWGVDSAEIAVLAVDSLGQNGDCLTSLELTVENLLSEINADPIAVNQEDVSGSLATTTLSPTVASPSFTITEICPSAVSEGSSVGGIRCWSVPGGLALWAPGALAVRVYAPDGRLVFSGRVGPGGTRVPLEPGVYVWRAGGLSGKALVR